MEIDLNKLRVFLPIFSTLSVRGAARSLGVTPAAVSMSLKSLERELQVTLFARSGRGLVATEHAERLAALAAPLVADVDSAAAAWREGRGAMRGRLRLGLPGEFGAKVVLPLMAEFRERFPEVTFTVRMREPQGLLPELLDGSLDVIVCDDGPYLRRYPQVATSLVAREDLVLACSAGFYAGKVRGEHGFEALRKLDHVAYVDSQDDLRKWYTHHFRKAPRLPVAVVADNVHAVVAALRAGMGLGLVPAAVAAAEKLRVVTTAKAPLKNEMLALRLKARMTTVVERTFLAMLKERAKRA